MGSMGNRAPDAASAQDGAATRAVEHERKRFGRDLHDILGRSLAVIVVKAELAQRLLESDPERARAELAELERFSRDAFLDLRQAVDGYHHLDLVEEVERAGDALRAAGIRAELPDPAGVVVPELHELFAWTVREGVTNVIRHSRATTCAVLLTRRSVEVRDDGVGSSEADEPVNRMYGTGLAGLRERAAEAGATLQTRRLEPGYALLVTRR